MQPQQQPQDPGDNDRGPFGVVNNVSSSEASTVISVGSSDMGDDVPAPASPHSSDDDNDREETEQQQQQETEQQESSSADRVATHPDESYDTAVQPEESYFFHREQELEQQAEALSSVVAELKEPTIEEETSDDNNSKDDDDIQSVDSDTAVNGRQTQRDQAKIDHSVIYGTYDESPVHTSSEVEEEDLDTSNASSAQLPEYPTDEEENEIIFEEPSSPGGSVYSGLFGMSLWNTRAMSFDSHSIIDPPSSPEYQQDPGRFWFWRKRTKIPLKRKPPRTTTTTTQGGTISVDAEPTTNAIVSPARTVATEGTTSGVDTPMMRGRRRRRRRMFPRMPPGGDSSSDDEHDQCIELQSTDDDDIELGHSGRSHHSGSDHAQTSRQNVSSSSLSFFIPWRSPYHSSRPSRARRGRAKRPAARSDHDRSDPPVGSGRSDPPVGSRAASVVHSNASNADVRLQFSPERNTVDAARNSTVGGTSSKGARIAPNHPVSSQNDDGDDDERSHHARRRRKAKYQLITFYRILCLAVIFVCLIIVSSVATAFLGAMLALDDVGEDGDEDSPPFFSGESGNGNSTDITEPTTNPCSDASAWLQLTLKFDSRPAETSIVLQGAGTFRSALWNFPEATFRSFTQFQRTNVFGICISRAASYNLEIGDAAADGLVSTLGVAGFTTTIYGNWEITLDGVQRAVYYGNCAALPSNNTDAMLSHCGAYCRCGFSISEDEWTGSCSEEC